MRATSDDKHGVLRRGPRRASQLLWRVLWWPRGRDHWRHPAWPLSPALHPGCLAATLLLAVNDWLLKPSVLHGPLTGKLSDIAGMVVAPLWLATLLGASVSGMLRRWQLGAAIVATGALFAAIKLFAPAAHGVEAMLALLTTPLGMAAPHIEVDATDLVALPALWLAWRIGLDDLSRVPLGTMRVAKRWLRARAANPRTLADRLQMEALAASGADRTELSHLLALLAAAKPDDLAPAPAPSAATATAARIDASLEKLARL